MRRIMSGGRVNACVYPPNPIIPTDWSKRATEGRLHILLCLSDNGASERARGTRLGASLAANRWIR